MLELKHLSKTFNLNSPNEHQVINDFSLKLKEGDFVTVIGSNGAGKSTLLNLIAGSLKTDLGQIIIDNEDVTSLSEYKRARLVGRVFQNPLMGTATDMWIEENLALAKRRGLKRSLKIGITKDERLFYKQQLQTLNLSLEDRLQTKVSELSGGQRQALTLLMATINQPKILLLDEHTSALDPATASKVLELTDKLVNEKHLTTIMITHNMNDALKYGNRLIMMDEGKIIFEASEIEKQKLSVSDLIEKFNQLANNSLTDSTLLTK